LENLEAQSLLGVEGFAEGLRHVVREKQQVQEIPKGQRFVARPSLKRLFSDSSRGKASRDPLITKAVRDYGYSQIEVASFLGNPKTSLGQLAISGFAGGLGGMAGGYFGGYRGAIAGAGIGIVTKNGLQCLFSLKKC
jgi:hypothetical protein